jgi:hypothetical protein
MNGGWEPSDTHARADVNWLKVNYTTQLLLSVIIVLTGLFVAQNNALKALCFGTSLASSGITRLTRNRLIEAERRLQVSMELAEAQWQRNLIINFGRRI